jgi:hypothetical protein
MKRRVFKDEVLQQQFAENAYCIVPLLSASEIEALEKIYYENRVTAQSAIEITIKNPDGVLNKKIKELTAQIILPRIHQFLDDHRMLHSGFIAKVPGVSNAIKLHQDSSLVDETLYSCINVWCPLVDLDEKNGALWVINHSDRFFPGLRGQPYREYDFHEIGDEVIAKYGVMLPMKAGEAIFYDTALMHYSKQNITGKMRVACNAVMVPTEAPAAFYHFNNEKKVLEKYEVSEDFLIDYFSEYLRTGKVKAHCLETIPDAKTRKIGMAEFEVQYQKYNRSAKTTFTQKLSAAFRNLLNQAAAKP